MAGHILDSTVITEAFPHQGDCGGTTCSACGCCGHCAPGHCGGTLACDDEGCGCLHLTDHPTPGQTAPSPVTGSRLEVATDAAAKALHERIQAAYATDSDAVSHVLTYDAHTDQYSFVCSGDDTSPCHQYPDHVAEFGECDHIGSCPKVAHDECWISTWVNSDTGIDYAGADRVLCPEGNHNECPPESRTGEITATHQIDWVEWDWAAPAAPALIEVP